MADLPLDEASVEVVGSADVVTERCLCQDFNIEAVTDKVWASRQKNCYPSCVLFWECCFECFTVGNYENYCILALLVVYPFPTMLVCLQYASASEKQFRGIHLELLLK